MHLLVLTLDAEKLDNPDLDLRYAIPDWLVAQSNGNIQSNGYDYEDQDKENSPLLAIFLSAIDLPSAINLISHLILRERVLGNTLSNGTLLFLEKDGARQQISFIQDKQ